MLAIATGRIIRIKDFHSSGPYGLPGAFPYLRRIRHGNLVRSGQNIICYLFRPKAKKFLCRKCINAQLQTVCGLFGTTESLADR